MSQGITLLDEALQLARQEKDALETGNYAEAIDMAAKRGQLTSMACNLMVTGEKEPFRIRLLELSKLQKQLTGMATRAHDVVRQKMNRSKQEKRRMHSYQMAIGHALQ